MTISCLFSVSFPVPCVALRLMVKSTNPCLPFSQYLEQQPPRSFPGASFAVSGGRDNTRRLDSVASALIRFGPR
ncbi:hypothetical protein BGZ61DRAFT_449346 [Ilyonectria robusta]|uniref:uncharacterized protein n=1 Tax=Ilyonectria robusta TaxID=1079257 RepID=UPI001E8DC52F|nr:uncharacterized protein BGZ61DRAFT_449346 [Ilyonectria robusta]KAH8714646.1 hypothetical protein BGZ61DRAFT_449346 [Ilyonectria robusta]